MVDVGVGVDAGATVVLVGVAVAPVVLVGVGVDAGAAVVLVGVAVAAVVPVGVAVAVVGDAAPAR